MYDGLALLWTSGVMPTTLFFKKKKEVQGRATRTKDETKKQQAKKAQQAFPLGRQQEGGVRGENSKELHGTRNQGLTLRPR